MGLSGGDNEVHRAGKVRDARIGLVREPGIQTVISSLVSRSAFVVDSALERRSDVLHAPFRYRSCSKGARGRVFIIETAVFCFFFFPERDRSRVLIISLTSSKSVSHLFIQ